ncbi:Ig-like domain-containing protein [Rhodopirellula baltica]|uniref:Outer membrane adhesin like protein n=1 Tax=Rhodopirellula baltica SWK14 TaxID=993516 RepID=L7C811_RHOBT|nr:Ig-like domain-containing protein [Rhodopirellula baltica]ELP30334.1 outer membrane adhesin like protein [Rhodopirellula baltica SWK14]
MSIRPSHHNFAGRTQNTSATRMQKMRERMNRWEHKANERKTMFIERQKARIERYRNAFKGSWITKIGLGLVALWNFITNPSFVVSIEKRPSVPFTAMLPFGVSFKKNDKQRKSTRRKSTTRNRLSPETLEQRQLLAGDLLYVDNPSDFVTANPTADTVVTWGGADGVVSTGGDDVAGLTFEPTAPVTVDSTAYDTIQEAIDAATSGSIINIAPGTYTESLLISTPGLTLVGPNASLLGNDVARGSEAVLEGVIRVEADDVTIAGLTIDGSGVDQTPALAKRGILVANTASQSNVMIENNVIKDWVTGVSLAGGASPGWVNVATISGNLFVNNGIGSTENVTNLTVVNNAFDNGGLGLGGGATLAAPIAGNSFSNPSDRFISIAAGVTLDGSQTFADMLSDNTFGNAAALDDATGSWYEQAIFSTISGATAVADDNATITVAAGTYNEVVAVSVNLTLQGASGSSADVVIDGTSGGPDDGVISIIGSAATAITIADLTVTGSPSRHGIRATTSPALDLVIDNVSAINNSQYGIAVSDINSLVVSDSMIAGNPTGGIGTFAGVGGATISGSDFSGQTTLPIRNGSTGFTINASGNYFGPASLSNAASVTAFGSVDYTVLLDAALDFETVYVHTSGSQVGSTGRIAEGIAVVNSGGTVVVQDGVYGENIDITQPVALSGTPTINGSLTLSNPGAVLDPGFSPGVITSGDLDVSGATVVLEIVDASGPGSGHDQLAVTGTVDVTGATLDLQLVGAPAPGTSYVLIDNDGSDGVAGEFAGFIDDTEVVVPIIGGSGTVLVAINYDGGDGNDVVATISQPAGTPTTFYADQTYTDQDGGALNSGDLVTWTPTNGIYPTPADVAGLVYGFEAFDTIQDATAAAIPAALDGATPLVRSSNVTWFIPEQDGSGDEVSTEAILVTEGDFDTISEFQVAPGFDGTVSSTGGTVQYTSNVEFNGTAKIVYTITDGSGHFIDGEIWVSVVAVNDAPVAQADNFTGVAEDAGLSGNLLVDNGSGADSDEENDTLTIDASSPLTLGNGSVTVNSNGTFTYTPNQSLSAGEAFSDSFTYSLIDDGQTFNLGTGMLEDDFKTSNTVTVNISGTGENDAPVATDDDSYAVNEQPTGLLEVDDASGLLANDTDVDAMDILSVTEIDDGTTNTPVASGDTVTLAYGDLTINANGSFDYQVTASIAAGVMVDEVFSYTVSDGNGGTDTAEATITITGQNDAPIANDDTYAAVEGAGPISGDLFADTGNGIDSDPDGDTFTVTEIKGVGLMSNPQAIPLTYGTLTINENGTFDYAVSDFPSVDGATETFEYAISDGLGGTDTATVTINITGENDLPIAQDDEFDTLEDTALSGNVFDDNGNGADSDLDEGTMLVASLAPGGDASNGDLTLNPDGSFTYTPDDDFNGTDSFTYLLGDGDGGFGFVADVTITVDPDNDAPVINGAPMTASTDEDTPLTISTLEITDVDVDEAPGTGEVTVDLTVTEGTLSLVDSGALAGGDLDGSDGTMTLTGLLSDVNLALAAGLTYTPNANFSGPDELIVDVSDLGNSPMPTKFDDATIALTVDPVNDAPVAVDDDFEATEGDADVTGSVLGNDNDEELGFDDETDTITVATVQGTAVTGPTTVATDDGGSVIIDTDGSFTYTPSDGEYFGSDTFTYTIVDDGTAPESSNTATVTINYRRVNDKPTAGPVTVTVDEDTPFVDINVLNAAGTTAGPANEDFQALTITDVTTIPPALGTINVLTVMGTQVIRFTPTTNFNGPVTFTYKVTDNGQTYNSGSGMLENDFKKSDAASVVINVTAVNDSPTVVVPADVTLDENTAAVPTSIGIGPIVVDDADIALGEGPDAMKVTLSVTSGSIAVATAITGTDIDGSDGTLMFSGTRAELNAALASVAYTPNENDNGTDSLVITVDDLGVTAPPASATTTTSVGITIDPVNTAPTVTNGQVFPMTEDQMTPLSINLQTLADDIETPDASLVFTLSSATVGGVPITASEGVLTTGTDGMWSFTTAPDFFGDILIVADVTDTGDPAPTIGNEETTQLTLTISVEAVNDAPVAEDFDTGASIDEDDAVFSGTLGVEAQISDLATDVDDTLTTSSFTFDNATVAGVPATLGEAGITYDQGTGAFSLNPTVAIYQPLAQGVSAEVIVNFTVTDGSLSDTGTIKFTVVGTNDEPVANDDPDTTGDYAVLADDTLSVAAPGLLGNDTDIDVGDTLEVSSPGTVAVTAAGDSDGLTPSILDGDSAGSVVINADGSFDYEPAGALDALLPGETVTVTFTYLTTDGIDDSLAAAIVSIVVTGVDDAPVAVSDMASTDEDSSVSIDVVDNDFDPDGETVFVTEIDGTAVSPGGSVVLTASGASVTLELDGTLTYDPSGAFDFLDDDDMQPSGSDSFTYTVSDGTLTSSTANVDVDITGVNDAPVAVADDSYTVNEDAVLNGSTVLVNDSDIDGTVVSATQFSSPSNGAVTFNSDGTFTYTPNADFNGTDTFQYQAEDDNGALSAPVDVTITVIAQQDTPEADDDAYSVNEDGTLSVVAPGVLGNDTDVDLDPLTVASPGTITVVTSAAGASPLGGDAAGEVTLNADGSFTYDQQGNFDALDSGEFVIVEFTYEATDTFANSNTATVAITVNGVDDSPVVVDDTATTDEDTPSDPIVVLDNDSDPETDSLSITEIDGQVPTVGVPVVLTSGNGTVTLNADDTLTFNPNGQFESLAETEDTTETFSYTVSDGNSTTDGDVEVTVTGVNDAPTAANDSATTPEDTLLIDTLTGGDVDTSDVPNLEFQVVAGVSNGTLTITDATTGAFTYLPNENYTGNDAFSFKVVDGNGGESMTQIFAINVTPVNDAPEAVADSYSVDADSTLTGDDADGTTTMGDTTDDGVLANDSDVDSPTLTVTEVNSVPGDVGMLVPLTRVGGGPGGTVTVAADGTFTYDPGSDFDDLDESESENVTFDYTISDGALTSTTTVTITVDGVDDTPALTVADQIVDEGSPVTITLAGFDPDGDTLTYSVVTGDGMITGINGDQYTYTPTDGDAVEPIVIEVSDGINSSTASFSITIEDVAPELSVGMAASIVQGDTFTRTVTFTDPGADADWVYTVDYDDAGAMDSGSIGSVDPKEIALSHTYADPGTYTITVTVTDKDGVVDTETIEVTVEPILTFTVDDLTLSEDDGTGMFTISVSSPIPTGVTIDVTLNTLDLFGATEGADYDFAGGKTVTFEEGDEFKNVSFNITDDALVEGNEGFAVNLSSTYSPGVSGPGANFSDEALALIVDNDNLKINAIKVGSTIWADAFNDFVDGSSPDGRQGYSINPANQFDTLPWINLNQIHIEFNAEVTSTLSASDFAFAGLQGVDTPSITSVDYDPVSHIATLTLSDFIVNDRVTLTVFDTVAAGLGGTIDLDGEYLSALPSGNDSEGGDFVFQFNVLPGDANANEEVNINDASTVYSSRFSFTDGSTSFASFLTGNAYDVRKDLDGSGQVDTADAQFAFGLIPPQTATLPSPPMMSLMAFEDDDDSVDGLGEMSDPSTLEASSVDAALDSLDF